MVFCVESFVYTIYLYWMYLFIYSYSLHHFNSQRCLPLCVLFTWVFLYSIRFIFFWFFILFFSMLFVHFFSQQAFTSHMRFTFMYFIQIIASWTANILIYQTEYITYTIYLYMLCMGSNILERWNRFVISFFVEFHSFHFICAL